MRNKDDLSQETKDQIYNEWYETTISRSELEEKYNIGREQLIDVINDNSDLDPSLLEASKDSTIL